MASVIVWTLVLVIRYALYLVEAVALLFIVRAALRSARRPGSPGLWERRLEALSRRRRTSVAMVGLVTLAARLLLLPIIPIRVPLVSDEFSYLLAADTFASGRITNPPHPMWRHFESIHINQQPTYMGMHHIAQGIVLAGGKVLGHPWLGVLLSTALMCALLCWMLQGWLPPKWALLGGLLGVVRIGLLSYWMNSYWGGSVAAIGGLFVLGAWPRLLKRPRVRDAVLMTIGVAILANSRPFEGFVLLLGVGGVLGATILSKRGEALRAALPRIVIPALLILCAAVAGTMHYYKASTGNPFRMPYQVNRDRYAPAQIFLWEHARPIPQYPDAAMKGFYAHWELDQFQDAKTIRGFIENCLQKVQLFWLFFLGPALSVPLIFLPRIVRDRRIRPLLVVGGVMIVGLGLNTWFYPHYAAPMTGIVYAVVMQGMRHLRVWQHNGVPVGLTLCRAVPAVSVAIAVLRLCAQPLTFHMPPDSTMSWYYTRPGNLDRAQILSDLNRKPGQHLAIVHYLPGHKPAFEWVYNDASPDAARVVWARDLGDAANRELIDYYPNRTVWLVECESEHGKLLPYFPGSETRGHTMLNP